MKSKYYAMGLDIAGSRISNWDVSSQTPQRKSGHYYMECACLCGSGSRLVRIEKLATGVSKSCGCLRDNALTTHGKTSSATRKESRSYWIWAAMKQRCLNPNNKGYPNYGGRGVTICDKWMSFEGFYSDMGDKPARLSLERINNNNGYSPENCKWADRASQNSNKRNNRYIEANGETRTITEWSRVLGVSHATIISRIERDWSEVDAVTLPKGVKPKKPLPVVPRPVRREDDGRKQ